MRVETNSGSRAEDAILLDTSSLTLKESVDEVVRLAREVIGG